MKHILLSLIFVLMFDVSFGQLQDQKSSGEIYEELQKFNFLGTALYIAAHPDDENTRLISYLSNGLHARTAYLSLTRGDGGQNLIGTEIRDLLGVLRSQELQMARKTDGGQQFFTRANDFGYSKHPDETLRLWDKDKVMEDIVQAIRTFKPDIIINRFDHRTPGRTHGHHTSSAMLGLEANTLAADPNAYPEQLKFTDTWKVHRHFFNTSWWFYGGRDKFAEADKSNLVSLEVGAYYPTLGISNNEISGLARSKHRSQGFGSSGSRGSYQEYLELLKGNMPEDKEDVFDGINTTWSRVKGGETVKTKMDKVMEDFDFTNPQAIVPQLLEVYQDLDKIDDRHWHRVKKQHLSEIIISCLGLFMEASTDDQQTTHGESIEVQVEATNRSKLNVVVNNYSLHDSTYQVNQILEPYTENKWFVESGITESIPFSNPYWLDYQGTLGTFTVKNINNRNKPQSDAALTCNFNMTIDGIPFSINRDVIYKKVDPSIGEIREPLAILPPATMSFNKEMYLLSDNREDIIELKVRASKDSLAGQLNVSVPKGWSIIPTSIDVDIPLKKMEKTYKFQLISPDNVSEGSISASFQLGNKSYNKSLINIDYDHIPLQTILLPAESKIVKVPLKKGGKRIAYIMGAGDKMPESLSSVGYQVESILADQLNTVNLNSYNAIVIGIRAYNAVPELKLYNQVLFDYVEKGGTLITQYNTSRRLNFDDLAPYPIKLSRKRVTDEYAEIRVLNPDHQVMNSPNKISSSDFDGWVQERGLYFPEEWDDAYETIISCSDSGESPLDGSILMAQHGQGYFVYTSISWFRQLPAGVPGAYRFFANLLALSSPEEKP